VTTLEDQIANGFAARKKPISVVRIGTPNTAEYDDARFFSEKSWQDINCADLDKHFDAIFAFCPEAFCYFLPGIFCAGIRENRPGLIVNDSLIGTLDRSNQPTSWDTFFLERWPKLIPSECYATQLWITWLSSFDPPIISNHSLSRAFDTITLISNRTSAIPMASR
jgi:hypothetical protein